MIARLSGRTILPTCLLLIWPLLLCLALSACGDLPQPFLHNPGATAQRLAQPPAPLLAVPPGTDTLLTDAGNKALADQLAQALQTIEVPAIVKTPDKADWHLVTRATDSGNMVQPEFTVIDPTGKLIYMGAIDDKPSPDPDTLKGAHNYVSEALEEAMSGKPVTTPVTRSYGCSVKYAE